jgi:hypothetical protein
MRGRAVLATTLALTASLAGAADVLFLRDGDRISGRIVSEMRRTVRIDTPYGTLVVPRTAIDHIEREAKPEAAATPAPSVAPPAARPARGARLVLVVLGKTFWQAWDPKEAPPDRSLRIEVRVDDDPVVYFLDGTEDPDEIPKAIVNAFSFAAADVAVKPAPNVEITPPEVRPGRVVLRMSLPVARAGERRVRVAYQSNVGTVEDPAWRDLTEASLTVELSASAPTVVQLRQDPGQMEFSGFPRRRMKHVETFVLDPVVE